MNSTAVGRVRLRDVEFLAEVGEGRVRRGVDIGPELGAVGDVVAGGVPIIEHHGGRRIAAIVGQARERRRLVGQQEPVVADGVVGSPGRERRSDEQGVDVVLRAVGQGGGRRELADGADDRAEIGQGGRVAEPVVGRRVGIVGRDGQPVGIVAIDHDPAEDYGGFATAVFTNDRFVVGGEIEIVERGRHRAALGIHGHPCQLPQALRAIVDDALERELRSFTTALAPSPPPIAFS